MELIDGLPSRGGLPLAHDFWVRGGYPEPWLNAGDAFRSHWTEQYIQSYLFRDVKRLFPGLDELRFRRFLELLGGLSGRILNFAEVARALGVSQPTARDYFEIAHGAFIWRTVPAQTRDTLKRVVKHPRGYVRDSGLLHALLRIPDLDALLSHPRMGASWEGMVVEEVLPQLNALGVGRRYAYYCTGGGAEVDLVLEGAFGVVAIEIKHTSTVGGRELRSLRDFVAGHKAGLGVVINNDVAPRIYEDQIIGLQNESSCNKIPPFVASRNQVSRFQPGAEIRNIWQAWLVLQRDFVTVLYGDPISRLSLHGSLTK